MKKLAQRLVEIAAAPRPIEIAFAILVAIAVFGYLPVRLTFGGHLGEPEPLPSVPLLLPTPPFPTDDIDPQGKFEIPREEPRPSPAAVDRNDRNIFAYGTPPPPRGGCCAEVDGEKRCELTTRAECQARAGEYKGDGVDCRSGICDPPPPAQGACCIGEAEERSCVTVVETACLGQKGEWKGDNSTCRPRLCDPPPAPTPPPPPPWDGPGVKLIGFLKSADYPIPCFKDDKETVYVARLGDVIQVKKEGGQVVPFKVTQVHLDWVEIANPQNLTQVKTLRLTAAQQ